MRINCNEMIKLSPNSVPLLMGRWSSLVMILGSGPRDPPFESGPAHQLLNVF